MGIGFIGAGKITNALLRGLQLAAASPPLEPLKHMLISSRTPTNKIQTANAFNLSAVSSNRDLASQATTVVLAIPSSSVAEVCREIAPVLAIKKPPLVSLVPGVSEVCIRSWLQIPEYPIIRAMTSSSVAHCAGTTTLYADTYVSSQQKTAIEDLFMRVGETCWLSSEKLLDVSTPLVGCYPAMLCQFIEALEEAARANGMPPNLAKILTVATVTGAALSVTNSRDPHSLLSHSKTPKGITSATIEQLVAGGIFADLCKKAYSAGLARVTEIKHETASEEATQNRAVKSTK